MIQLEQLMSNIEETKMKIHHCKDEVDSIVHEVFAELRKLIDLREEALLTENNRIAMAKEACLSIQLEATQRLLESTFNCHSLSSIATSHYSDVQLLS